MSGDFVISQHAAERYVQRVAPQMTLLEARAAIRTTYGRAIEAAVTLGCHSIRLASGHRLVLRENEVVTIWPPQPKVTACPQHSGCGYNFRLLGRLPRGFNGAMNNGKMEA